jgi:subtilisin-like proprotein convertase family protein
MGSADITVTVAQPANRGGLSSRSTFTVNVLRSPTPVFANIASIQINDRTNATPYPSTVEVSGVVGKVRTVSVDIIGLTHSYPSDVSMLILGPKGQKVVLMSRAGNGYVLSGTSFQFDQGASNSIPQGSAITSGTSYKPENYNPALTFYEPIPAGPIVTNLNAFADTDPNGTWSLYVQDDQSPDSGNIAGGWTLRLVTTAPTISTVAAQVTPENTTLSVPISVNSPVVASSNLTVTASSSGSSPTNLIASVTVTMNATNKSLGTITIVPTADLPSAVTTADGTSTITVSVTDGTNTASTTFPLTVLYVNQPPKFVGLQNLSTPANYPVSLNFSLTDVDSPSSSVALAGPPSSSNTNLGTVTVAIAAGGYILNFVPAGDVGVTTVSLVATDGVRFTTNNVTINVLPGVPPVIAEVESLTMAEATTNRTITVDLSITNSTTDMTVTGVSSNTNLATVRITGSGAKWTALVDVAAYVSGETTIGIVASTSYGNGNRSFKVTVTAVDYPPVIATIPAQTTTANIPITVPLTITDPDTALSQLTVTAASSDTLLVTSSVVSNNGTNASVTLNVAECRAGVATITVTAKDNTNTVTSAFQLTVRAPQPPVIESIDDITNTNTALTFIAVPVEIESPLKPITALTITGSTSNTNLVSEVTIAVSGTNVTANLVLVADKKGLSTITISVSDCVTTVTETFNYIVPEPTPATMSATVTNGVLTINLTGGAGTTYTIQNSIDLVAWTDVTTVTADANGKASYSVSLAGKPNRGFYRTVIK